MIHTMFKNLDISAQIKSVTMHEQALLDLYSLETGLSTWILHSVITSKKLPWYH